MKNDEYINFSTFLPKSFDKHLLSKEEQKEDNLVVEDLMFREIE